MRYEELFSSEEHSENEVSNDSDACYGGYREEALSPFKHFAPSFSSEKNFNSDKADNENDKRDYR